MAEDEAPIRRRPNVLIVDDDTDTLNLIAVTIQKAGYVVLRASTGVEALKLMDTVNPDVVVLDLMMPLMSGMEVMRLMKAKFPWPPPVIMFTAKGQIEDKVEGLEAGAFRYLVKPAPKDVLLEAIDAAVREKRGRPRLTGRW
jgi:DNA-binding response OmpR family regulator